MKREALAAVAPHLAFVDRWRMRLGLAQTEVHETGEHAMVAVDDTTWRVTWRPGPSIDTWVDVERVR